MRNASKWIFLFLLAASRLAAQAPESLLIGPGDMLHVQVFDTAELEQHARVTDAGEISMLLGGSVKVSALTPAEAARAIEKVLLDGHYMLQPRVLVAVEEYATQKVSVLGEVKNPGAVTIGTPRSVLDVLALAGGITDMADRKILIERRNSKDRIPYFVSNKPDAAFDTAFQIYPGDTLFVPRAGVVYVLGDVAHPGGYTMTNNEGKISVLELVARAGGTNNSAVPSHTRLIRKEGDKYIEIALPLSAMQKGNRTDMPLQPDDIVYVPFSYLRNFATMSAGGVAASATSAAIYQF
ncbi:MAG: polysaccharide biosynthesis/export family protein [Terracidiphilus sp.]|jgi:polysaccharide biosynthesis/export protein